MGETLPKSDAAVKQMMERKSDCQLLRCDPNECQRTDQPGRFLTSDAKRILADLVLCHSRSRLLQGYRIYWTTPSGLIWFA